jgi:hypothetical protein
LALDLAIARAQRMTVRVTPSSGKRDRLRRVQASAGVNPG